MINFSEGGAKSEEVSDLKKLADRTEWSHSAGRVLVLIAEEAGIQIPTEIRMKALAGDPKKDAEVREFIAQEAEKLLAQK